MHLHFDCFSGISGDMTLGALVDLGLSPHALRKGLKTLPIPGYRLKFSKVYRGAIHATKVEVIITKGQDKPLSWPQIRRLITKSTVPLWVKHHALSVFERLAQAEGVVHGKDAATVHFHEVGVIDSLVDIVGALLGFHELGISTFSATPINVGSGTIDCTHGALPVPGPAVAELAKGYAIFSNGPARELTTPTGMALVATLVQTCSQLPPLVPSAIGYGAGTANPHDWPNVLRVFLAKPQSQEWSESDQVIQLETNIDDMNPQIYESVMERLFEHGALDVNLTPTIMKRNRPGIILTVLAKAEPADDLVQTIFRETTSIGVRRQVIDRVTLSRSTNTVRLPQGKVRVKTVQIGDTLKHRPEFQDCQVISRKTGIPVQDVITSVIRKLS
jgi:pyridinium-3,5-bisthiocarboxylic acid mononucleotide nickel chelatase